MEMEDIERVSRGVRIKEENLKIKMEMKHQYVKEQYAKSKTDTLSS